MRQTCYLLYYFIFLLPSHVVCVVNNSKTDAHVKCPPRAREQTAMTVHGIKPYLIKSIDGLLRTVTAVFSGMFSRNDAYLWFKGSNKENDLQWKIKHRKFGLNQDGALPTVVAGTTAFSVTPSCTFSHLLLWTAAQKLCSTERNSTTTRQGLI